MDKKGCGRNKILELDVLQKWKVKEAFRQLSDLDFLIKQNVGLELLLK